ncbi:preprotein translocase subunit SecE [Hyphobacterium sp.]|uniref:preprotein translocase subunit SecE n=1 Tax=Hyphobacterium sp. TaxID=2004662 RepID=UPI003BAA8DE0
MAKTIGNNTPAKKDEAPAPKKKRTNPFQFFQQVRQEGRKVTWTSRQETIVSTIMVLVMASLAALFFFGVDSAISFAITQILRLGA